MQLEAFDRADPRLRPYFEAADAAIADNARLRRQVSLAREAEPYLIEMRRDRRRVERQLVYGL